MYKLHDPLNNTAMDIHEYLDVDFRRATMFIQWRIRPMLTSEFFSGSHQECTQSYASTMDPLTQWLKTYQLKAFVSEFGGDNTTSVRDATLSY